MQVKIKSTDARRTTFENRLGDVVCFWAWTVLNLARFLYSLSVKESPPAILNNAEQRFAGRSRKSQLPPHRRATWYHRHHPPGRYHQLHHTDTADRVLRTSRLVFVVFLFDFLLLSTRTEQIVSYWFRNRPPCVHSVNFFIIIRGTRLAVAVVLSLCTRSSL